MIRTHIRFPGGITVERVEPRLSSPGDPIEGEIQRREATHAEVAAYMRLRTYRLLSGPQAASIAVDESLVEDKGSYEAAAKR